jgi:hypothetical protein
MSDINDFIIEDGVLTKYVGQGGDVVIPSGVKKIKKFSFRDQTAIKTLTISNGVVEIEHSSFEDCTNLTHITIPDGVIQIGAWAFKN